MVSAVILVLDTITLFLCLLAFVLMYRIYGVFKGGSYARSYAYYVAAIGVLAGAFVVRVFLDLFSINPEDFGFSVRDLAVIIMLALFVMGTRSSVQTWRREA